MEKQTVWKGFFEEMRKVKTEAETHGDYKAAFEKCLDLALQKYGDALAAQWSIAACLGLGEMCEVQEYIEESLDIYDSEDAFVEDTPLFRNDAKRASEKAAESGDYKRAFYWAYDKVLFWYTYESEQMTAIAKLFGERKLQQFIEYFDNSAINKNEIEYQLVPNKTAAKMLAKGYPILVGADEFHLYEAVCEDDIKNADTCYAYGKQVTEFVSQLIVMPSSKSIEMEGKE